MEEVLSSIFLSMETELERLYCLLKVMQLVKAVMIRAKASSPHVLALFTIPATYLPSLRNFIQRNNKKVLFPEVTHLECVHVGVGVNVLQMNVVLSAL